MIRQHRTQLTARHPIPRESLSALASEDEAIHVILALCIPITVPATYFSCKAKRYQVNYDENKANIVRLYWNIGDNIIMK